MAQKHIERRQKFYRAEISETARLVFAKKGIANTSLYCIAQQGGFAMGTINKYFDCKEHLLRYMSEEVLEKCLADVTNIVAKSRNMEEAFLGVCSLLLDYHDTSPVDYELLTTKCFTEDSRRYRATPFADAPDTFDIISRHLESLPDSNPTDMLTLRELRLTLWLACTGIIEKSSQCTDTICRFMNTSREQYLESFFKKMFSMLSSPETQKVSPLGWMMRTSEFMVSKDIVGRLTQSVARHCDEETAADIACACPLPFPSSTEQRADWVLNVCSKIEARFDENNIKGIMAGCHCQDRLSDIKTWFKELYEETGSVENFVTIINEHNGGWYIEGRSFFTRFWVCECPMLFGIERLPSRTWCNCSVGYSQKVWEHVFECPVTVELLSSIKTGHDVCLMKVSPARARWCQNEED